MSNFSLSKLRKTLFVAIEQTITKEITYRQATAITGLANAIVKIRKAEKEYQ